MRYRTLGRTGMAVSPLCLGNMMLGSWGNPDHDDAVRIVHRALDAGINFIDTADVYSAGESEIITGKALAGGRRDEVILATKCHFQVDASGAPSARTGAPPPNVSGSSRRYIFKACEASLRRLGTDWIDLYQIHRPDPSTDIDETLGAFTDLVHQGKIRAFGSSTFPADEIVEAQWVAERRGRERFQCEQPPYSILARGIERDVLPAVQRYGIGCIVWSPLSAGWLTGRYRKETGVDMTQGRAKRLPVRFDPSLPGNQRKLDIVEELVPLADKAGVSMAQMAIAFTLEHPGVTSAIIGPRTMDQLETLLGADEIHLDAEILDRIDELVPPGTNLNPADSGWEPPWLRKASLRRRAR
jgi:aryl-alcohol dehydrogenase-like predicted oxidoreductase